MIVFAVTALERLLAQHRPTVLVVGAAFSALILFLVLTYDLWQSWTAGQRATSLALGLLLRSGPHRVAGRVRACSSVRSSISPPQAELPMVALAHTMTSSGVGNFVLLALPFFIFAGIIMNQGGISLRLVRLVQTCVGHFRGGLFQVMVVSMYIVSGLSGSKAADVAAVGSVMRDMLRREGYNLEQATAVLASSAVMGETVPPSLAMLVLGSVTTLSMGALFIAGLIPAVVVGYLLDDSDLLRMPGGPWFDGFLAPACNRSRRRPSRAILPLLMPVHPPRRASCSEWPPRPRSPPSR